MKTISVIAAMAKNRAIGNDGKIPWSLPADLAHFKRLTTGHPVIMGRKTYESIRAYRQAGGRPLPERQNIVVTRQSGYRAEGCDVVESLGEAIDRAHDDEIFVIGGAEIYKEALPLANRIYLTLVEGEFPADAYFPEIDERVWREVERAPGEVNEKNLYPHTFLILEKSR